MYPTDPSFPHFASLGFLEPVSARRNGLPTVVAIINSLMLTLTLAVVGRVLGELTFEALFTSPATARLIAGSGALIFAIIIFFVSYRFHAAHYCSRIEELQKKGTTHLAEWHAEAQMRADEPLVETILSVLNLFRRK